MMVKQDKQGCSDTKLKKPACADTSGLLPNMETIVPKSIRFTNFGQTLHQSTLTSRSIISMYYTFLSCPVKFANCAHHFFLSRLKIVTRKCFSSITYRRIKVRLLCTVSYCFSRVRSYTLLSRPNICQFCYLTLSNNLIPLVKFYLNELVLSRFRIPTRA